MGEGSQRRLGRRRLLEKVFGRRPGQGRSPDEGLGRRPRAKVSDEGLMIVLYKGYVEKVHDGGSAEKALQRWSSAVVP
jgi:hypothetical protein